MSRGARTPGRRGDWVLACSGQQEPVRDGAAPAGVRLRARPVPAAAPSLHHAERPALGPGAPLSLHRPPVLAGPPLLIKLMLPTLPASACAVPPAADTPLPAAAGGGQEVSRVSPSDHSQDSEARRAAAPAPQVPPRPRHTAPSGYLFIYSLWDLGVPGSLAAHVAGPSHSLDSGHG